MVVNRRKQAVGRKQKEATGSKRKQREAKGSKRTQSEAKGSKSELGSNKSFKASGHWKIPPLQRCIDALVNFPIVLVSNPTRKNIKFSTLS